MALMRDSCTISGDALLSGTVRGPCAAWNDDEASILFLLWDAWAWRTSVLFTRCSGKGEWAGEKQDGWKKTELARGDGDTCMRIQFTEEKKIR